ncbi:hypothetical protein [Agrobacterium larrymoorei]|uniref:Uncharacterized protein n=1 Tax=Agrobacterium larrymoorei TaxID=160699 RepID=A0A4D7DR22_9HYPH|nr:hypothetical protein [Agrobacterium larrymoorei]QCI98157.1 hypothetical protein CFBP5473_09705 [Agrobacterium larrymoorei]QYA06388.1 hypothetical protein J5285_10005 [Agrobacterium larrymoorei]WHA40227.1 hypothetical protein CFBP5477_010320 [Agrobacterium larrymoorei]
MSKSVAYLKFKVLLEQEIRTFWHLSASLEYAERWLKHTNPAKLTSYPGDSRYPFRAIDISPGEFTGEQPEVLSHLRENTLVSFVTTFESYLSEILERIIYLHPSLLSDSEIPFLAKELCEIVVEADVRRWFASRVTDKYLRNKTHPEMIKRIDKLCEAGVSKSLANELAEWSQWSLVRNSVVHTARQTTQELSKAWPARFPTPGGLLAITNEELARIHHLALNIAAAIDARAIKTRIQKMDELLIAREIFIQRGISEPNALVAAVNRLMKSKITQGDVQIMLSQHKKRTYADSWHLTFRELSQILD